MGAIFQKMGKEMLKRSKIFKNLGKNVPNLKILKKGQVIACDNQTKQTARISPGW